MISQCVSSAIVWVANVVAQTDASARIAPTDRSMPPPVITKVMPMLTTPMMEANRRIVSTLSMLANRSPAVIDADDADQQQRDHQAEVAPEGPLISAARERRLVRPPPARPDGVAGGATVFSTAARSGSVVVPGRGLLAHAAFPSMTRSRTR